MATSWWKPPPLQQLDQVVDDGQHRCFARSSAPTNPRFDPRSWTLVPLARSPVRLGLSSPAEFRLTRGRLGALLCVHRRLRLARYYDELFAQAPYSHHPFELPLVPLWLGYGLGSCALDEATRVAPRRAWLADARPKHDAVAALNE